MFELRQGIVTTYQLSYTTSVNLGLEYKSSGINDARVSQPGGWPGGGGIQVHCMQGFRQPAVLAVIITASFEYGQK